MNAAPDSPYVWLRGSYHSYDETFLTLESVADLSAYLEPCKGLLYFDFETNMLQWWHKDFKAVGLGVWYQGADAPAYLRLDKLLYVPYSKGGEKPHAPEIVPLLECLLRYKLSAYNIVFDGGVLFGLNKCLTKKAQLPDNYVLDALTACPLTLFRMLANEGKQSHSLDVAQQHLLHWTTSQKVWLKEALSAADLTKKEMWKLQDIHPKEFAQYCAIDAMAAGLVWKQLLDECNRIDKDNVVDFHLEEGMSQIRELIESAYYGIPLDRKAMKALVIKYYRESLEIEAQLRCHPQLASHISQWETERWNKVFTMAITTKHRNVTDHDIVKRSLLQHKDKIIEAIEEDGDTTPIEVDEYKGKTLPTPPHLLDGAVVETYYQLRVTGTGAKPPRFNFGSAHDRTWLFYTAMGSAEKIVDEYEKEVWRYTLGNNVYYLPPTKSGGKPTGKEIFPVLGKLGDLIKQYKKVQKLYEYAVAYYAGSAADGKIHWTYSPAGTHTGRLAASGGVNCFPPEVEILTTNGWKSSTAVSTLDKVWQIDPQTLQGEWVLPTAVTVQEYSGELIQYGNRRGKFLCTPNHRILWTGDRRHISKSQHSVRIIQEAEHGIPTARSWMALAGEGDNLLTHSDIEIWKSLCLQADGSARLDRQDVFTVGVRKPRKIEKLTELFGEASSVSKQKTTIWSYIKFSSPLLNVTGKQKLLDLSTLGGGHVDTFLEALNFWDGTYRHTNGGAFCWSTTEFHNAEEVQKYLVRNGCEARLNLRDRGVGRKPLYHVSGRKLGQLTLRRKTDMKRVVYTGLVGCVSVPTGIILIRSGGQCFVVGNSQQLPKVQEFLECFRAPEGYTWISHDFCGLEKVVQAEFTGSPALIALYASGKEHDVHLFNTKAVHPDADVRKKLEAAYKCDKETLDKLKKEFKAERNIGKSLGFSLDYGAGIYKVFRNMNNSGFPLPFETVSNMVKAYRTLYKEVYEFGYNLQREWDVNGGVIENGLGFPISIPERYRHDTLSRFVQNTGHCMLMKSNNYVARKRRAEPHLEYPIIPDLHDERIGMCRIEDIDAVKQMYYGAVAQLNDELKPNIPFTISTAEGPTLWEIKK